MSDLVIRLRDAAEATRGDSICNAIWPEEIEAEALVYDEAADRIEELEKNLREERKINVVPLRAIRMEKSARIKTLEAALRGVVNNAIFNESGGRDICAFCGGLEDEGEHSEKCPYPIAKQALEAAK